jgi:energy-coupling factor transport system ATP-binding protein
MVTSMRRVGLDPDAFAARSPFSLSGGERRRVAIAGLLAMQPRHLVLDEPVAGLDPAGRELLETVIAETAAQIGVVLLTADLPFALRLADRVILLDAGSVLFDGLPADAVRDSSLLGRLHLLAPVEAEVVTALQARGAPVELTGDMRPASVLRSIANAVRPVKAAGAATPDRSR